MPSSRNPKILPQHHAKHLDETRSQIQTIQDSLRLREQHAGFRSVLKRHNNDLDAAVDSLQKALKEWQQKERKLMGMVDQPSKAKPAKMAPQPSEELSEYELKTRANRVAVEEKIRKRMIELGHEAPSPEKKGRKDTMAETKESTILIKHSLDAEDQAWVSNDDASHLIPWPPHKFSAALYATYRPVCSAVNPTGYKGIHARVHNGSKVWGLKKFASSGAVLVLRFKYLCVATLAYAIAKAHPEYLLDDANCILWILNNRIDAHSGNMIRNPRCFHLRRSKVEGMVKSSVSSNNETDEKPTGHTLV